MATQHASAVRRTPRWLDSAIPDRRQILGAIQCPFAERINPHADSAERSSLQWLERLGLVPSAGRLAAIGKAHLTTLVAGFYPCAALEELKLASDYVCWAFALDDIGDETSIGERPARLMELFARFEQVLSGEALPESAGPLEHGLHQVVQRVASFTSARQLSEFLDGNRAYFGGMLWEANNRAHSWVPDETAYLTFRPAAGAVPSFFALIEPLERISLAPRARDHEAVRGLSRLAGSIICWTNDVLSYEKERAHGDFHNLVMVYEHHRQLLPGAAAAQAIASINAATRDFVAAAASLPSFGAAEDSELKRYIDTLRAVIRVTLSWTYDSARYRS
jgi:Terpene synthase family 2, C-terminal metal binding